MLNHYVPTRVVDIPSGMLRNSLIVLERSPFERNFSVRVFRQMVLRVLFLEKGKGNVVYHLPEKRVVPVEKQMKRSIFFGTGNCGQMERKFPGIPVKSEKKGILRKVSFFRKYSTGINRSI